MLQREVFNLTERLVDTALSISGIHHIIDAMCLDELCIGKLC